MSDDRSIEKAKLIDECLAELSPQEQTAVQLWVMAVCEEMKNRARLRGQRPGFGPAMAKELLFIRIVEGL